MIKKVNMFNELISSNKRCPCDRTYTFFYFSMLIAIDEAGSFRAAPEVVGRTQSAVTQQMQTFEHLIGTPLFVTKGRRRELTEAGRTLLRRSRDILALYD